jgi:hypothetical protein
MIKKVNFLKKMTTLPNKATVDGISQITVLYELLADPQVGIQLCMNYYFIPNSSWDLANNGWSIRY